MTDAIGTGKWDDAIPVSHGGDEDHLRGEIQQDVAMLSKLFGSKLKRIRFRPAYGRDFDFIRMDVHPGKPPRFQPSVASIPEFPLQPPGIWLVAEAVVELYDMEMPVATWYAVETDDGVCGLASSAFSHRGDFSAEEIKAVRDSILGLLESESRRLASDGRVRTISQYLRHLPAGPAGQPVLSIMALEEPVPLPPDP